MRKSAKIILFKNNKVLLQLRQDKAGFPYPNTWTLLGGRIEKDETPEKALKRELKEELNLKLKNATFIIKTTQEILPEEGRNYAGEHVEYTIFATKLCVDVSELALNEGQALKLFTIKELNSIKIVPFFKKIIIHFFKTKNPSKIAKP